MELETCCKRSREGNYVTDRILEWLPTAKLDLTPEREARFADFRQELGLASKRSKKPGDVSNSELKKAAMMGGGELLKGPDPIFEWL